MIPMLLWVQCDVWGIGEFFFHSSENKCHSKDGLLLCVRFFLQNISFLISVWLILFCVKGEQYEYK